jgi:uncharacterized sodium:solute symporter family permease YidK
MAAFLLATFYATMVATGLATEFLFRAVGLAPHGRHAKVEMASITWNYTTVLNIIFLIVAAVLVWRFVTTGGMTMLRMMNKPVDNGEHHHSHASGTSPSLMRKLSNASEVEASVPTLT